MTTTAPTSPVNLSATAASELRAMTPRNNEHTFDIELTPTWDHVPENESSLPSVDGGRDAWMVLAAACVTEILVWGFPWSYGIFQQHYTTHTPFTSSPNIPVIGSSAMGILYMTPPLTFGTLLKFPRYKRVAIVFGLLTMCLSLGLSSLCTTVPQLIVTQGILYGVGGAVTYSPVIQFLDEWFVRRKGLAFGVMWAGTGVGGIVIPLLLEFLLGRYGFRTTLRIWSVVLFCAVLPLTLFLKPRLPVPATNQTRVGLTFLKDRTFLLLQLGNVLEGFGFFVPAIYLPTYAKELGVSGTVSALTIVILNVASVFGSIAMGTMIDRWDVTIGISVSTIGAVLSVFISWGFSTSLSTLFVFASLYGLFAGSFVSTWPGIIRAVQKSTGQMESVMILSFLSAGRGVGNLVAGPVSEALVEAGYVGSKGLYGTRYGSLVLFTGISAALGGVGILGKRLGWV